MRKILLCLSILLLSNGASGKYVSPAQINNLKLFDCYGRYTISFQDENKSSGIQGWLKYDKKKIQALSKKQAEYKYYKTTFEALEKDNEVEALKKKYQVILSLDVECY
jgi:hypothetical protein